MRVITSRTADSPVIGPGSQTCGALYKSMATSTHKNQPPKTTNQPLHNCPSDSNVFCYVCGKFDVHKNRFPISEEIRKIYKDCFGRNVRDLNHSWVPSSICKACNNMFTRWKAAKEQREEIQLKIKQPTRWRKPQDERQCYFCNTKVSGFNVKNKSKIVYADVSLVTRAIESDSINRKQNENVPSPLSQSKTDDRGDDLSEQDDRCNESDRFDDEDEAEDEEESEDEDGSEYEHGDFKPYYDKKKPIILYTQEALNDLIRNTGLPKDAAEYLASDLKWRGMLEHGVKSTIYRDREKDFREYFVEEQTEKGKLVYCNNVKGLINTLKPDIYKSEDWRLFVDSSTRSLKAVLFNNENVFAPMPIAHSTQLKEEYMNLKLLLEKIHYSKHNWLICGDFKILSMILGQQSGFTKTLCYLCLWDSRDRKNHFKKSKWDPRLTF